MALHGGDPAAPQETIAEHAATQAEFLDNTLQPLLKKGRAQDCQYFSSMGPTSFRAHS